MRRVCGWLVGVHVHCYRVTEGNKLDVPALYCFFLSPPEGGLDLVTNRQGAI